LREEKRTTRTITGRDTANQKTKVQREDIKKGGVGGGDFPEPEEKTVTTRRSLRVQTRVYAGHVTILAEPTGKIGDGGQMATKKKGEGGEAQSPQRVV